METHHASPFVGRDAELAALGSALAEAAAGRGGLVVVTGEPGVGKSRLVREAVARGGAGALWGRCWEAGGAPAWWPWSQALRGLGRDLVDAISGLPAHVQEELGALALIARSEPGPRELMPGDALAARFRIMQAVVALLHEVARSAGGAPRVVVLEDVHAADVPSLLLLQLAAVELAPVAMLVIATARDAGATMSAEARQALDRAAAAGRAVPLARLGADAVATLVRGLRADVPAATIDAIQAATQGNPLFVEGLVRALPAGALELPRAVPSSLREAIAGRVHVLGAEARALVEVVAVMGDDASEPRLARVAGLTPARASGLCGEAVAAGVLAERARERYGFVHGLVRDAVYRGLDDARREALHAKAADALASAPGAAPAWAEIAHHLIEAGPGRL
ncbi:MAG: AAA family ATPase, partial [Deltaproteobacteria bacterium]|nr:AAA family ATPase [Deltaproteobacteria bacterium]